jgi:hypothetical protein
MARADERRVTVRLSHEEYEDLERACRVAGVPLGAMARVCALNWCAFVAAEMAVGRDFGFRRGVNRVRAVTPLVEER